MTTASQQNKSAEAPATTEEKQADKAQAQAEAEAKGRLATLSARTKEIMDTDIVRPAQILSYEPMLAPDQPVGKRLGEFEDKDLRGFVSRSPVPPRELSNELRSAMEADDLHLPPSHVWVKGIIATFIVLQEEKAALEETAKKASRK